MRNGTQDRSHSHRDPQAYEECEDWSLQMTDEEEGVLNALVLMQEPGDHARNLKAGLGFDRAFEDEMKERPTVKVCRRDTVFQQGNEEENKECTHETAKLLNRKLLYPPREQVEAEVAEEGCGFERAHETELSERKILKLRRKTEKEEKIESAEESVRSEGVCCR